MRDRLIGSRRDLRPLAEVRCSIKPSPILAAVYYLDGERWLWTVGYKLTPRQLAADELDDGEWLSVAETVTPLDRPRTRGSLVVTCRKCRLSWLVSTDQLDEVTVGLPHAVQRVLADRRAGDES